MDLLNTYNLYMGTIMLYFLAAIVSLAFLKLHKLNNLLVHSLCMLASLTGVVAAVWQIWLGDPVVKLAELSLPISLITINITIDRLASFFVLALSVLVFCVSVYSLGYISHYFGKRNVGLFNFLYSSFVLSMFFVFIVGNAILFFVAWEIMSLLSYFLVVFESEQRENQKAGILYIVMTHIGASFLLIGFMMMYSYTGSFDIFASSTVIPIVAKNVMFLLFLVGFGVKAGIIPFHIWLPYAHPAASSNVSALMSGIMIKTAIYGLIRFVLFYLNISSAWWGPLILGLGIVSAVLGVAYALMEQDIKRLLAFSSIENIGIILIGLGISFLAFAQSNLVVGSLALTAALFHTFNHTLFKGGLFLGAGAIQYATGTKNIEELGGLIKKLPITSLFVLGFALAISAIVPFNGFVSEWLTYQSLFLGISMGNGSMNIIYIIAVAALAMAGALAAVCFIKLFGIAFLGLPRSEKAEKAREVPVTMQAGMGLLAALCLLSGVLPMLFLRLVDKVVSSFTGTANAGQLQGGWLIAYYPVEVDGNSIYPLMLVFVIVLVVFLALGIIRLLGGPYRERKYGTWDCGYRNLNARMQYSGTGFSKPLRIVFRILYRPTRKLETGEGSTIYFPVSLKYSVTTESIFERYLYNPILFIANRFSIKAGSMIQTGSIHLYLLYILAAIVAAMLYNRIV